MGPNSASAGEMPTATISCLHPQLKAILVHEAARHIEDAQERRIFLDLVKALADCRGTLIGLETSRSGRAKRAPSPFNLFLKQCASSKANGGEGKDFKTCAVEWKQRKAQGVSK